MYVGRHWRLEFPAVAITFRFESQLCAKCLFIEVGRGEEFFREFTV